ncbi:MAG: FecR domain-containing protein [Acidovorax sp.]|nr:FecR domain-containing protein [Acidovorax sp.]
MSRPEQLIAAYLDDALTEAEQFELAAWLKADPANLRTFVEANVREQQLRATVQARRELRLVHLQEAMPSEPHPAKRARAVQWRNYVGLAAAAAIVVLTASWLFFKPSAGGMARLGGNLAGVTIGRDGATLPAAPEMRLRAGDVVRSTGRGGSRIEFTGETTRIMLAPRTAVELRAVQGVKQLALMTGRVQAEVAKQRAGAMIWTTDDAEARVIGTKFALSADGMLTRLDVTEGSVELLGRSVAEPALVRAGQFAATDSQGMLGARSIADADSPALWNSSERTTPGCVHTSFRSAEMQVDIGINVLLPPLYEAQPQRRFPVLYFLHGLGGDEHTEAARFAELLRAAMARGELPEFIAVFPNVGPGYTPRPVVAGRVFARELPQEVDARFRTVATREGRVLCGLGYGGKRAVLHGTIGANVFGASCAVDDTFRGGTPSFLRLIESFRRRIEQNPPHLLLLHGQPHATPYADTLVTALRSKGIAIEARKLPSLAPESEAYHAAILAELRTLLNAQWPRTVAR